MIIDMEKAKSKLKEEPLPTKQAGVNKEETPWYWYIPRAGFSRATTLLRVRSIAQLKCFIGIIGIEI